MEFTTRPRRWAGNPGWDTPSLRGLGLEARLQPLLCEEARDLWGSESREGSLASSPQMHRCLRPDPFCRCQARGTAITHPEPETDSLSFIYYYVQSFLCKRQPYINFIFLYNGLGYITNNIKMEKFVLILDGGTCQVTAWRFQCSAQSLWELGS